MLNIKGPGWNGVVKVPVPYDQLRDFHPWVYEQGKGLVIRLSYEELADFVTVVEWLRHKGVGRPQEATYPRSTGVSEKG